LYSLEESARANLKHKPTFQAIMENNEGQVVMKISSQSIDENDDGPE
jgi:DNA-directed RNA polymerase subunit K/omega